VSKTGPTLDALRAGIASGRLTDVLDDILRRLTPAATQVAGSELARFRRDALLHRSTIAAIEKRRRDGSGTAADEQQARRVTAAVIELIDAIEPRAKDSPLWSEPPRFAFAPDSISPPAPASPLAAGPAVADEEIFVSYKREDRNRVAPLVAILRGRGWNVFWDPQILPGTANWDMLLERKLGAAKCILVVWSKSAAESEFVRTEAHHGRNQRTLISVTIDGTVPATFALSQTVDLSGWSGDEQDARIGDMLKGIAALIGR
jgi:TIR domain